MATREKIREGIEQILLDNHIKGEKYQKNFTDLALEIMEMESEKGLVIKVEGELPEVCSKLNPIARADEQQDMLKAGYVAVEPLIEEVIWASKKG